MKSGNLNFLESSGSLQARNGTAFYSLTVFLGDGQMRTEHLSREITRFDAPRLPSVMLCQKCPLTLRAETSYRLDTHTYIVPLKGRMWKFTDINLRLSVLFTLKCTLFNKIQRPTTPERLVWPTAYVVLCVINHLQIFRCLYVNSTDNYKWGSWRNWKKNEFWKN